MAPSLLYIIIKQLIFYGVIIYGLVLLFKKKNVNNSDSKIVIPESNNKISHFF